MPTARLFGLLLGFAALVPLVSCSNSGPIESRVTRGLDRTDRFLAEQPRPGGEPAVRRVESRPVALVDGAALSWDDVRDSLAEAAGGAVLEEFILARALEAECAARNITITEADLGRERRLALDFLSTGGASTTEDAERLLARIRAARGLGDKRFAGLVRRNAMMRALVAGDVSITPAAIDQAYQLRFGERTRARLMILGSSVELARATERLNAGEPFSTVAAEMSSDPSAERGGLIEPISQADESYPVGIRKAAQETAPGSVSRPVLLDGRYALVMVESKIPASEPPGGGGRDAARAELERDVRLRQERLLMNTLARRLLAGTEVQVLDRSAEWSWRNRRE